MSSGRLSVACSIAQHVNVAFQQNAIPVVQEIALTNEAEDDACEIEVRLSTVPSFTAPLVIRLDRISAGTTHHVRAPDIRLDADYLRRLTEGLLGEFVVEVVSSGGEPETVRVPVRLHPPSHWGGSGACPELVAAFVRPNDPVIDVLLHDASRRLGASGKTGALEGYRRGGKERAWEVASAIWSAIAAHGLTYVLPPASFERAGQKVRGPADILERKTGTCLDLTLLYAAVLEQAGLNPLVVLVEGHAFVGLWLKSEEFSTAVVDDMQVLRKRRDLEDLIFVETTALTSMPAARFSDAVALAARHVDEDATAALEIAVDIRRTRAMGITPLDLGDGSPSRPVASEDGGGIELAIDDAPPFSDTIVEPPEDEGPVDRLERWKRKLLDLTLRNKMLNFKPGAKSIALECPDPARLEDILADGGKFKLLPKSEVLAEGDARDAVLHRERHHGDGRAAFLATALEARELHTFVTEKELDGRLTELYRMTRTAFEEGGANILFLAIGFLKWTQKEGGTPLRAPLLLVPVALQRSSVRAGYRLAAHEEEARFNPTLLEMLRQDFQLRMPELEKELPTDVSGLDVPKILRLVRSHVVDLKGWEVTGDVVLATFSFTKFLMWRDLVERMETLKKNPVVRHLIDTPKVTYDDGRAFPAPERIDVDHHPRDVFAPLSADSSQLSAVLAAAGGKDFVLFGPPGTGKSQTIANMISQCLALGKTVLFVSQKTAALEVVRRRLRDIGLGDYCLEVHSAKAQKTAVLEQLKTAWHERAAPAAEDWNSATSELARLRDELNGLVRALHRRHGNGLSAHEAFGRVIANRGRWVEIEFDWSSEHDRARLDDLRELCRDLSMILREIDNPAAHPLAGIAVREWSPGWRRDLDRAIGEAIPVLEKQARVARDLAAALDLPVGDSWVEMRGLQLLGTLLGQPGARQGTSLIESDLGALRGVIGDLEGLQSRATELSRSLAVGYRPIVFDEDLRRLMTEWTDAVNANMLFRGAKKKKVRQTLQPFALGSLPDDIGPEIATLIEITALVRRIQGLGERLTVFGSGWAGQETDTTDLKDRLDWVERTRKAVSTVAPIFHLKADTLLERIIHLETREAHRLADDGDLHQLHRAFVANWTRLVEVLAVVAEATKAFPPDRAPFQGAGWIEGTIALFRRWQGGLDRSPEWCRWQDIAARAAAGGLDPLVAAVASGTLAHERIGEAFEVAHARWWITRLVDRDPVLSGFLAVRHEDVIARFRAADERIAELSKRIVRGRLAGTVPPPNAFGKDVQLGTLSRELNKKQRHMPLRQLFGAIPEALTRLTPCVMMSPLSIAQYLPAESRVFDVVIFDEASQIPVWDAIGAIARGRQVVIAGDPEQLPPTSVGERGVDDIEDGIDVEDQESILSECIASNIPPRRLDWHYRSRHESLIAFSNREYYGGRLVTFPSPVTRDRAVRYVHVPGGVYERGSGRVNREEARAVVAELVRRLTDPAFERERRSIGIVTFNGEQQRLIENLLDAERRSDPSLEPYFDPARWHEPVFVKNLENVQGDERDTIFFSIAVAPDASGRGVSTISSLNKDGGYRRLNVAITRARQEMVVFATLRPDQIDLSRTRSRGVRDFKHFLEFAERGPRAFAEAFAATGEGTDSPFEDAVMAALQARGWVVHTQIGVSGFRVDLGIVHPDAPGRYLAGVECDGATYHRSATARDRDRLRENVLVGLGWRIRRVWSTEWWQDGERALAKLHDRLTADLEADRLAATEAALAEAAEAATAASRAEAERTGEGAPDDVEPEADPRDIDETTEGTDFATSPSEARPQLDDEIVVRDRVPAAIESTVLEDSEGSSSLFGELREPERLYAAPVPSEAVAAVAQAPRCEGQGGAYRTARVADCGFEPDPDLFYAPEHRHRIRKMVAHVIAVEAPIYEDVLVHRIARAHGFSRAAGRIREVVLGAVDPAHPRSRDDDRTLLWALSDDPSAPVGYRIAETGERDHGDIPLAELASLARIYRGEGADEEEILRRMATTLGLGKLREATRRRFTRCLEENGV